MDDATRQSLKETLACFDEAEDAIRKARKPFDDAIIKIDEARSNILERHDAEIVGECEGCSKLLIVGDKGYRYDDGPILCEGCSPTFAEADENWDGCTDVDGEDAERKQAFKQMFAAHLAARGGKDDKLPLGDL